MEQSKALKILKENRQALADKYGVKKLSVAVEYMPDAEPAWDFLGLN